MMLNVDEVKKGMRIGYIGGTSLEYGRNYEVYDSFDDSERQFLMSDKEKLYIVETTPNDFYLKIPISKLNPAEWIIEQSEQSPMKWDGTKWSSPEDLT